MNPRLVAISGPLRHSVYAITEKELTFGRAPDNDVVLDDKSVSRRHFSVWLKDGRPYLRDRDTGGGTEIDGEFQLGVFLESGNRISCGSTTFLCLLHDDPPDGLPVIIDDETDRTRRLDTLRADYSVRGEQASRNWGIVQAFAKAAGAVNAISNTEELQVYLVESALEIIPARRAAILLNGSHIGCDRSDFVSEIARERDHDGHARFPLSSAVLTEVYASREPRMTNDITAVLCVPLIIGGRIRGVMYMEGTETGSGFEAEDLFLLKVIANFAVSSLRMANQHDSLRQERDALKARVGVDHILVGASEPMKALEERIQLAASSDFPVLILGETGTGKELVARRIHELSVRAGERFVAINCAAISDSLVESEFFGHVKGAFTGAMEEREGKFEQAHGGTLFLDEVGELKLETQPKLLRVLQEYEVERVGGKVPVKVDVRVLAATNVDLEKAMHERKFRPDLFYRLQDIRIVVPPLREHREDIPLLVDHFIEKYKKASHVTGVSPEAMDALMAYNWPGNVRQLQSVVATAIALARKDGSAVVRLQDLEGPVTDPKQAESANFTSKIQKAKKEGEAAEIDQALRETGGNVPRAAGILGITPSYLYRILRERKKYREDATDL
jgi:transcriptional regulator with GAF, ATPase, and Fis domain